MSHDRAIENRGQRSCPSATRLEAGDECRVAFDGGHENCGPDHVDSINGRRAALIPPPRSDFRTGRSRVDDDRAMVDRAIG
jgi:hypothetical protein